MITLTKGKKVIGLLFVICSYMVLINLVKKTPEKTGDPFPMDRNTKTLEFVSKEKNPVSNPVKGTKFKRSHRNIRSPHLRKVVLKYYIKPFFQYSREIKGDRKRQHLLEDAMSNHFLYQHLKNVVEDKNIAESLYGSMQASVRVFAIEVLSTKAIRERDPSPLEPTLNILLSSLTKEQDDWGVASDFMDLLASWIEAFGKEEFLRNPEILFQTIDYKKNYRPWVASAIRYVFPEKIKDHEFHQKLLPFLRREV